MSEVLPELFADVEPLLRRALAGEELRGVELSGMTPARPGIRRIWRESFVPLRDAGRAVTGVTISVEEITGEKLAERRGSVPAAARGAAARGGRTRKRSWGRPARSSRASWVRTGWG
jgi:hypothetical protein